MALLARIKKGDMNKYGKYQCTNEVKEDMVGWVTIWQKWDEDAIKKETNGKEKK